MFKKIMGFFTNPDENESVNNQQKYNRQQQQNDQASRNCQSQKQKQIDQNKKECISQDKQQHHQLDQENQQQQFAQRGRIMSIQEQLILNQKFMIYENEFSDYLILLDQDEEIKVLSSDEWKQIVVKKSLEEFQNQRIQFSLLKGIPYDVRKDVWLILSKVEELKIQNKMFNYEVMSKTEGPSDKLILKDLNRTFSDMRFFQIYDKHDKIYEGREKLFRVLRAYSHFDQEIGYTQGMNFIAASLLVHLNPDNEKDLEVEFINKEYEENTFWILVHIMHVKNWRILFLDGTPGIHQMIKTLDQKMKEYVPQIFQHIADVGLDSYSCFSQYFFTILLYNAPKTVQKRILDLFLFEGEQILYSVIIKMLTLCSDIILSIYDMQKMMEFFKKGILDECHKIFKEEKKKGDIQFGEFKFNIAKISDLDLQQSQ
ncbi:rab-GTPase-TBC domain protein (macronuclear) [Tetrahymena thermophila SB210]|uniref:Rab-GTPase-TBC domain protein n=1 Tax=Tetrahymena thermophila (strain SB210) TaxID=312017 RepID=I7M0M6_TETTS|nr:rab-GTPase-TBC domain protein [Tetrahymena thermophila SB210]EAR89881.3 rab-GTPase-TBC domain protein [Tetrahymena thermophila SB210]|eukprot:XP_001010126.3 rab-GTPase-TBC domain protein [Tetrahymena thermophila SB210]